MFGQILRLERFIACGPWCSCPWPLPSCRSRGTSVRFIARCSKPWFGRVEEGGGWDVGRPTNHQERLFPAPIPDIPQTRAYRVLVQVSQPLCGIQLHGWDEEGPSQVRTREGRRDPPSSRDPASSASSPSSRFGLLRWKDYIGCLGGCCRLRGQDSSPDGIALFGVIEEGRHRFGRSH